MNRKLLSSLLLLTVATGGVCTFTSCKDDGEDFRSEVLVNSANLQKQIDSIKTWLNMGAYDNLNDWINKTVAAYSGGNYSDFQNFVNAVVAVQGDIKTIYGYINDLNGDVNDLKTKQGFLEALLNELKEDVSGLQIAMASLENRVDGIDEKITELQSWQMTVNSWMTSIENWQSQVNTRLDDIAADVLTNTLAIESLEARVKALEDALGPEIPDYKDLLDSLQNQINDLKASNEEILNSISALWTAHEGLQTEVSEVQSTLEALGYTVTEQGELINTLTGQVATIEDAIEDLYEKDAQFAADIEKLTRDLQTYYSFIKEKFAKFITSIELNATFNPLFGTLNLPIGISSNILSTYIYSADHRVNFPIISTSYEFDPDSEVIRNNALYNAISKLREGASDENVQINAGTLMVPEYPDHNNMGELYVTINPKNVELDGVRVSLVNSKDEAILTHSSHIALNQEKDLDLSFTTRADGPNLYSIPVELTPNWEDVDQIALHLENKSEFVYAIKDAIKDHTISDFAHVGRMIYDYLQDFLPAYALKISWQDPGDMVSINGVEMNTYEENAVYSNYGIAATTVHPLSYSTGFGFGVDKKLPLFDPISEYFRTYSEKLKNSLKIDLGSLGGFQPITFEHATIEINVDNVKISLAGTPVYNDEGEEIGHLGDDAVITLVFNGDGTLSSENEGDLQELISAIEDAIGKTYDQIDDLVAQVNNMINEINDQLGSLEGNINGQISDLIDRVNNALKGKLKYADKLVDLYNQLAARVNQFLDNPNHYLQVVMAYTSAEGGMHHLSNNQAAPTRFNVAGGNAFELFATSYNADLIVPSYKKYVAISQVFTTKGEPAAEMNNNIVAINEAAGLNKILRGDQQRVPVNVSNKNYFKPGYTYQVYYSSLDYRGYTSTQVYYFTIAE